MTARRLALDKLVEPDSEHAGDELEEGDALTLAVFAEIRRPAARRASRSGARAGRICNAAPAGSILRSRGPACRSRTAPRPPTAASTQPSGRVRLKLFDLLVRPPRLRRFWRAQDEKELRRCERGLDLLPQGRRRPTGPAGRGRSGVSRRGTTPLAVSLPASECGTRNFSSSRCSQSASSLSLWL